MAAITYPRTDELDGAGEVRGAGARAAAVRSRGRSGAGARDRRPSLFAGDGRVRRPGPPVRLTSVPLVAHDDLASLTPARPSGARLLAVAEPGRTARPGGPATARKPSAATYRRRRLVVAALFLGTLLTVGWVLGALGGGSLAASEGGSSPARDAVVLDLEPVSRSTYVVAPGDTLWSIARALQPEGDVRPVVDALAAARQGRPLEVGETIVLP